MATFEAQVAGLTSLTIDDSSSPTRAELNQFLTDGAKEVINVLPVDLIDLCASSQSFTSGTANTLNTGKVLRVFRSDGDIKQPCRKVDAMQKGRFSDSEDMNYATITDPVYYVENNSLDVLPVGGSATYSEVQYPTVSYTHEDISVFPDEAEYLVSLYAAVKSLQNAMGNKTSDLPSDLSITANSPVVPSLAVVSYTDASNSDASASLVGSVVVANVSKADISGNVPTYTKPAHSAQVAFSSYTSGLSESDPGVLSVSSVTPSVPTISSQVIADPSGFAPTYTKPVLILGDTPTISDLSIAAVPPDVPSLASVTFTSKDDDVDATAPTFSTATVSAGDVYGANTVPTYSKPAITTRVAFSSYTSGLSETDPGVLSITAVSPLVPSLTSITFSSVDSDVDAFLPIYSTATISAGGVYGSNTPPTYTKPSIALSFGQVADYIDSEEDVELASAKLQQVSAELNEYQANIQNEQAEFNKENIAYQANIQESMQELQAANQVNIAEAQGGLQLAISNEDRSQQRVFQNAVNDMKVIFDGNVQIIQKYQAELSAYQANINKEVQQYTQKLSQYSLELNTAYTAWAKTESDSLQQYQLDIQNELNEYNKENLSFQANIQEAMQEIQVSNQVKIAQGQADLQVAMDNKNRSQQRELQNGINDMQAIVQNNDDLIGKYSAELQQYQAEVSAEVQEYQQNLAGDIQVWQSERTTDLQKYGSDIQNELNEFNKENAKYQAILQEYVQEAQLLDAHEARKIQKYQAEVSKYQAEVDKEVQEYGQKLSQYQVELNTAYQAWAKTESDNFQVFQLDVQNELNEFNKENVRYQANVQSELAKHNTDLQKFITQAQLDAVDAQQEAAQSTDVDKFNKAQEQVLNLTNASKQMEDAIADNNSKIQKYSSELQLYQNEVNKEVQEFTNNVQKHTVGYQWLDSQYQKLSADYQRGIQMLIGGGIMPQQQQ
jgi:transposase